MNYNHDLLNNMRFSSSSLPLEPVANAMGVPQPLRLIVLPFPPSF